MRTPARDAALMAEFLHQSPRMARYSLLTFPATDPAGAAALRAALAWWESALEGADGALYIFGPNGTGKSGLAWSVARAAKEHWPPDHVRFVIVRQWLAELRRSFSVVGGDRDPTHDLVNADLLILDDLGAERPTEWAVETIAYVVDHRYEERLWTIVTSNYAPHELIRRLGGDNPVIGRRIVSRLLDGATQVRLDRADLRIGDPA